MSAAMAGDIPLERLTFAQNKVYKKEGNVVPEFKGTLGESFAQLANTVCKLWHVQEKVYEFEAIPVDQKDGVIKGTRNRKPGKKSVHRPARSAVS